MKYLLILCLAFGASVADAQVVTTIGSNQDPFQKNLYSADRVMELRNELKLTDDQATKIKKIHSENAGKFSTMKWDLDDATMDLKELLDESKIDEAAVQKQMDKVLALENSLKKQQLSTMVSIKNELNPEQQEILQGQRVQTVNGVNISGYGVKSVSPTGTVAGYPNVRVAKGSASSSTKVAVQAVGAGQENAPLYMIETTDGMKQVEELKGINPNDIESMQVLKDKTAVEKYGEKGKNGVIIVKLKGSKK